MSYSFQITRYLGVIIVTPLLSHDDITHTLKLIAWEISSYLFGPILVYQHILRLE